MAATSARLLLWTPRVLGILLCMFLGLFALDAFSDAASLGHAVADFLIHLTPALLLLVIVAASWQREWIGGAVFVGLGIAYAASVSHRLDWIVVISGPLVIVGALFFWSWRHHARLHGPR